MQNKKIDAFTLSEILVVLVVSSIAISLTFMVLRFVQKQVATVRTNFRKQQEIILLDRLLWHDFNTYDVSYNQRNDVLTFTNNVNTITYAFEENYILRQEDTIKTLVLNKSLFLNGQKVTDGIVDAIEIYTEKIYKSNKLFVNKPKDATYFLNK